MKKFSNKILIITLLVLLGIFVFTKVFRSPARDTNLNAGIFKVDTAKITAVQLRPQKDSLKELRLVKKDRNWTVVRGETEAKVQPHQIRNLLGTLAALKPERIATRKKEKWDQYNVDDSTSSEAVISAGDRQLLRLHVGKETSGITYVRVDDEEEVYAIDGYLKDQFNKGFNDWRDQAFLRLTRDQVTRISFHYPSDSGFVMEKKDKGWMIGNESADSAKVEDFLIKLTSRNHDTFDDNFKADRNPDISVTFTSGASNTDITIKGWKKSFYEWILNSSQQPTTYFLDVGSKLTKDIFVGEDDFLPASSGNAQ